MYDVLAMPRMDFPAGFFWGSSTSAYQIEGGAENTDRHRAWQQGRVKEPCGRACDHWNRWREDVALIRDLGHQVCRFSNQPEDMPPVPASPASRPAGSAR